MPLLTPARAHAARTWLDLVLLLVQRDLRVRYRGSVLGYLWSMANPMLYMTILSFVFAHLVRFKVEHYAAFILSGILGWNLFQQSLAIGVNSVVGNGALLRKVKVPATIFPASSVGSVVVNFLLALGPYVVIALVSGVKLTGWFLLLPFVVLPYLLFIFGIVLFLCTLNVSFRDVGHVLEPLLTMIFYATPVFYPLDQLPDPYRGIIQLNPLTHFIGEIRRVIFFGEPPAPDVYALLWAMAALSLVLGTLVYRKSRDQFVYNL